MSPSLRQLNAGRAHSGRFDSGRSTFIGVLACGLLAGLLGACGIPGTGPAQSSDTATPPDSAAPPVAAPSPRPAMKGPCPYLDTAAVESMNGQRVDSVRISADQPYPACFFYRGDGHEQLRTWIVVATPEVARATVDAAVPVATSDLAELPGGWSGGSQSSPEGAVFAVTRQDTAVVVTTNQPRTLGAKRIAEQVIAAIGR